MTSFQLYADWFSFDFSYGFVVAFNYQFCQAFIKEFPLHFYFTKAVIVAQNSFFL